jgi:hypothetical protein
MQVHPRKVPQPKGTSLSPSAHALHNLAHIELNAIDLAWDTVVRFSTASRDLDDQFFADFAHVADDESRHCLWCLQRLSELGFRYLDQGYYCLQNFLNLLERHACHSNSQNQEGSRRFKFTSLCLGPEPQEKKKPNFWLEERIKASVYLFSGFYQFSNSQACYFVITRVLETSECIRH